MAGDRGDDLAGVQRTKRSGVNGTTASSSSGPLSRTREGVKARDPRARERAAVVIPAGSAGLTALREGWPPVRGETMAAGRRLDAQRNSPAVRSRGAPESSKGQAPSASTVATSAARQPIRSCLWTRPCITPLNGRTRSKKPCLHTCPMPVTMIRCEAESQAPSAALHSSMRTACDHSSHRAITPRRWRCCGLSSKP